MPKFAIQVSAQLAGVSSFATPEDYPFHLVLGCGSCGERTSKPIVISDDDEVEGIRGAVVNLKISCKLCDRVNDVTLIKGPRIYSVSEAPEFATLLELECRGTEPLELHLADDVPLIIKGLDGFLFEDAFIRDGEFYSYDEKLKTEASITEFKTKVVKI